ncbi:MAG: hypothetical protein V2I67_08640 [Thermoanaerobaculales bacterium]|jgi:hypothetical protein|nr:hypothetical protein [Thermoanaerobaculales bacterium]
MMPRSLTPLVITAVAIAAGPAAATTLDFDGELLEAGTPANGVFDFRFRCLEGADPDALVEVGPTVEKEDILVSNGRFSVELDFGTDEVCSDSGWIQTSVARGDRLGGFTSLEPPHPVPRSPKPKSAESMPPGAITFFALPQCPPGWTEYIGARGRAVVGVPSGGTVEGTLGVPLSNLEERQHQHVYSDSGFTDAGGVHQHSWATIQTAGSDVQWSSYDATGSPELVFSWQNGIGTDGSGIYPLSASPNATYYTEESGVHQHSFATGNQSTVFAPDLFPYIQLLACRKN